MSESIEFLYPVALLLAPLLMYWQLCKRPNVTRRIVLIGMTLAGSGVSLALAGVLLVVGVPLEGVLQLWPWVFLTGLFGLLLGVLMLVARAAGGWLSGRP